MPKELFGDLVNHMGALTARQNTSSQQAVSRGERLVLMLKFLAIFKFLAFYAVAIILWLIAPTLVNLSVC
jgi:hypothetical protein